MSKDGETLFDNTAKLEGVFKDIGLTLFELDGSFKSTYDILVDLSSVWGDLSDTTQASLSFMISGIRRSDILAAALTNIESVIGATETALNSFGSALEENAIYMDSIVAKTNLFKKEVQDLWINAINSDSIKTLVDMGTGLVKIADSMGLVQIASSLLIAILIKLAATRLTTWLVNIVGNLINLQFELGVATANAKALQIALLGLKSVGIIAVLAGITFGISKLIEYNKELKVAYEGIKEESKKYIENFINQEKRIDELLKTLKNAKEGTDEYKEAATKLGNILPQIVDYVDDEGIAHLKTSEAIDEHLESLRELSSLYNEVIKTDFTDEIKLINDLAEQYKALAIARSQAGQAERPSSFYISAPEDTAIFDFQQKFLDMQSEIIFKQIRKSIAAQIAQGYDLSDEIEQYILKALENTDVSSNEGILAAGGIAIQLAELLKNTFGEADFDFSSSMKDMISTMELSSNSILNYSNAIKELDAAQSDMTDQLDNAQSEFNALTDVINKLNDGMELSGSETLDLIQKYPQLVNSLEETKDGYILNVDALEILRDIQREEAKIAIQTSIDRTKAKLDSAMAIIKGYTAEVQAISTLAEAESALADSRSSLLGLDPSKFDFIAGTYNGTSLDFLSEAGINMLKAKVAASKATTQIRDLFLTMQALENIDLSKLGKGISKSSNIISKTITKNATDLRDVLKDLYNQFIDLTDTRVDALDQEIDMLNDQKDLLREQWEIEDEINELHDSRVKLLELENNLANIQKEKNVKLFKDGKWIDVASPQALREAQKQITEQQLTVAELEDRKLKNDQIRAIEDQISVIDKQRDTMNDQIKVARDQIDAINRQSFATQNLIDAINSFSDTVMAIRAGASLIDTPTLGGLGLSGTDITTSDVSSGSVTGGQDEANRGLVSSISELIRYGMKGDSVRKLQSALEALGYSPGGIDGIFGSKTKASVKAFQSANDILADGIVGNNTKSKFGIHGYEYGGDVDYTGLAMVHGSKSKPEHMLDANVTDYIKKSMHNINLFGNMMSSFIGSIPKVNNNSQTDTSTRIHIEKLELSGVNDWSEFIEKLDIVIPLS